MFFSDQRDLPFSADCEINDGLLQKLLGCDLSQLGDMYDIQYDRLVRVRRHKKKRIDKKWEKRYGYKLEHITLKGYKVEFNADGSVTLIKPSCEDIEFAV